VDVARMRASLGVRGEAKHIVVHTHKISDNVRAFFMLFPLIECKYNKFIFLFRKIIQS
jgi:hypothetical protein